MPPLSIMIKPVSGACNMHCQYCFYTDVMSRRETRVYPKMTIDALETIVRRAFRYANGPVTFAFQGGEPTLIGLPFFEALVRFEREYNARRLPVTNTVQTNGYDLSDDMISFFARERFLLGISLDGTAALHDQLRVDQAGNPTYQRVLNTINRLSAAGVEFNILCVVNDFVAQQPRQVFQALAPYKYLQFIACLDDFDGTAVPYSLKEENYLKFLKTTFDFYYEAFQKHQPVSIRNFDNYIGILLGMAPENCAMGGRCGQYYLIESDGSVYPCDFYVLDKWKLGNILETPLNRLAGSERSRQFQEESIGIPDQCQRCKWYFMCRNGCKRERDAATGRNRWCECFQDFFAYSYPRMQEMAKSIRENADNV